MDPYLFISIDQAQSKHTFEAIGLELSIHSDYLTDAYGYIPEGLYFNGKVLTSDYNNTITYKLRYSKEKPNIRVEFSAVSDDVKYALTTNRDNEKSDDSVIEKEENGRKILTIDKNGISGKLLYFKIFTKNEKLNPKLDDYVFKYTSTNDTSAHTPFIDSSNDKLDITKNDNIYTIKINSIKGYDVSYYIKAIYKDGKIDGEKLESIAISESEGYHMITETFPNKDEKHTIKLQVESEIYCIKVIAKVNVGAEKYFLSYKPKDASEIKPSSNEQSSKDDDDKIILYVSIGVGSFLVAVVIILVIFVIWYKGKNKNLMDQVNKISFVQSGSAPRDDDNLLLGSSE